MSETDTKYFDLMVTGLGYVNRIDEVTPEEGTPFLSIQLSALRGSADAVKYTRFECRVVGAQAKVALRALTPAIDRKAKVLIGFTLSDLRAQAFLYKHGERTGEPGAALTARLIKVDWARLDGEPVPLDEEAVA